MRQAYSYVIGFFAVLVTAKSLLSQLEGVNLGESVSLWILPPLLLLVLFFPPGHFVWWGGGAALVTIMVAEGYERSYHFLKGEWLPVELSISFFWVTAVVAVITTVVAIRMQKQK